MHLCKRACDGFCNCGDEGRRGNQESVGRGEVSSGLRLIPPPCLDSGPLDLVGGSGEVAGGTLGRLLVHFFPCRLHASSGIDDVPNDACRQYVGRGSNTVSLGACRYMPQVVQASSGMPQVVLSTYHSRHVVPACSTWYQQRIDSGMSSVCLKLLRT